MSVGKDRQGFKLVILSNLSQTKETSIPDDWLVKRIDEIGEKDPETIDESKYEYSEIEYIDIGAIADFKITKTEKISLKDRPSRAQKIVRKDDIIISTVRPYLMSFTTIDNETKNLVCSTGFAVIRAKDSVLSQLIFSNTQSHHFNTQMIRLMQGSNYPAVTSDIVGNVMIPYPPDKEEREKIASILSNVDAQMQQTQKLIDLTQRLKKGLMQKLLTRGIGHTKFKKVKWYFGKDIEIPEEWQIITFKQLITNGPSSGLYSPEENYGTGDKIVGLGDVFRSEILQTNGMKKVKLSERQKNRSILKSHDLVFSRYSLKFEGVGKCLYIPKLTETILFESNTLRVSTNMHLVNSRYLGYYFNTGFGRVSIIRILKQVSATGITGTDLKNTLLVLPNDIEEQQKIASILSNVDEQIQQHKNEKALLERIKNGLMQQILTGQRRVKVGV